MISIISQSKQELTDQECIVLKQLKVSLDAKWKEIKCAGITDKNMVPKSHYYRHICIIGLCVMLKMAVGLADDEGMEAHHRICNAVRANYLNQRGKARVMHSMDHIAKV
eukprot:599349_1